MSFQMTLTKVLLKCPECGRGIEKISVVDRHELQSESVEFLCGGSSIWNRWNDKVETTPCPNSAAGKTRALKKKFDWAIGDAERHLRYGQWNTQVPEDVWPKVFNAIKTIARAYGVTVDEPKKDAQ